MKTSIEKIKGKRYTVVWHSPKVDEYVPERLVGGCIIYISETCEHIATALPALPRHPKPEDAQLLYRYMAEGVEPWLCYMSEYYDISAVVDSIDVEITHATDTKGNKIEVAIEENE